MACCAALAVVLGALRAVWFRLFPGRRPPEPGFAPPARRSADGLPLSPPAATASAPPPRQQPTRRPRLVGSLLLGVTFGVAAYAVAISLARATPLVRTLEGAWLARDIALVVLAALALTGSLALRTSTSPTSRPAVLVGAGAAWTELGLVDMHLLGLFEFRVAALPLDLLLHGGGLVLLLAAAPHLTSTRTSPRASTA
ncbi:hypothetical protein ASE01_02765 [Nocardioides sp. Root190]|uniref:hypothetical protein n=1 Tax=Nocardioides sp. Root190 TaxID=1736488 RepID=UPI0006F548EC|nr:hypothetical protein [Nocardioides sp. Root190]KRB80412.1 hypothetical protein ASE01_02765 [Nocardioides sp. Root190]